MGALCANLRPRFATLRPLFVNLPSSSVLTFLADLPLHLQLIIPFISSRLILHLSHFIFAIQQRHLGARQIGDSVQIVSAERDEKGARGCDVCDACDAWDY